MCNALNKTRWSQLKIAIIVQNVANINRVLRLSSLSEYFKIINDPNVHGCLIALTNMYNPQLN